MKRLRRLNLKGISLRNIIIELIIVFCGVYMAFYLNDREEEKQINQQSIRILKSLMIELEQMRITFPDQSAFMKEKVNEWVDLYQKKEWGDYYDWRYLQPQYNYTVLEYAINERETEIIDFALYKELMRLYKNIRQLEEAERYMTSMGYEYHPRVQEPSSDPEIQRLREENLFHFYKFINAANDRSNALGRVAGIAENCLDLIRDKFTRQENIEITSELCQMFVDSGDGTYNRKTLEPLLKQAFPDYSDDEVEYILNNLTF